LTAEERPLNRDELFKVIRVIAKRAGVDRANVHRFRHSFAIEFLRNGGRPLHLKSLLGHATMGMVDRYVALAQIDLDSEHDRASPIDGLAKKS
jgi:integrase/recombinase XerD